MSGCNRRQVNVKFVHICLLQQDPEISQLEGLGGEGCRGTSTDLAMQRSVPVALVLIYGFLPLTLDGGFVFSADGG